MLPSADSQPGSLPGFDPDALFGPQAGPGPEPDPFGRIGAGDPAWEAARGRWMEGASLKDLFGDHLFSLNDTVGTGRANRRGDVFKLQALLHREDKLDAEATGGPTGYWGNRDDAALRALQKDNGLTVDGWAGPRGETIERLRRHYASAAPETADWLASADAAAQGAVTTEDDADVRRTEAIRSINRDLATVLGLDPGKMDLGSSETMRALSAARFYHHLNRQDQYKAMQDIARLQRDNPELMGALRGKVAASITNPVWEIPMMTPERLQQARRETEQGLTMMQAIESINDLGRDAWRYGKPKGAPKAVGRGLRIFDYGIGAVRQGFEKALTDIDAEEARRRLP